MADEIRVDTSDYRRLADDLRFAALDLGHDLQTNLRLAADPIEATARVYATDASRTIPPSIAIRVAGGDVVVSAGGPTVPLAGLMELGNKGAGGGDMFLHPVFGHLPLRPQKMHPYLVRAARTNDPAIDKAADRTLDDVTGRLAGGSHG